MLLLILRQVWEVPQYIYDFDPSYSLQFFLYPHHHISLSTSWVWFGFLSTQFTWWCLCVHGCRTMYTQLSYQEKVPLLRRIWVGSRTHIRRYNCLLLQLQRDLSCTGHIYVTFKIIIKQQSKLNNNKSNNSIDITMQCDLPQEEHRQPTLKINPKGVGDLAQW